MGNTLLLLNVIRGVRCHDKNLHNNLFHKEEYRMQKEWTKGSIEVHFEDAAHEKTLKRSYSNTINNVTPEQVEGFTLALESLTTFPYLQTVMVEEYTYTR